MSPELEDEYGRYHLANYELLRVLKGKLNRPLKAVGHPSVINGKSDQQMPNPAVQLLHPGTRVLMFSYNSTNVDTPCEILRNSCRHGQFDANDSIGTGTAVVPYCRN